MHEKRLFGKPRRNRKWIIIISIIAVLIIVAILILTFIAKKKQDADAAKDDAQVPVFYDTTVTGDAAIDPENTEIMEEDGVDVKADELSADTKKSNGIDVSKWQGKIDWKKVKKSGIEFAFIRIGYRGEDGKLYKDDNADYNIQQAQKAGVLIGVYFFSTAVNKTEAKAEAEWTIQAIKGYHISYPVVYDCEGFALSTSRMYSLTAKERTANALAFLETVSAAGYDAMLYGALNEIENSSYWEIERIQEAYKIWIAQYPTVTYPTVEKPSYSERCDAWQYTNKGSVNGIAGNVDMVVCYFTKKEAKPKDKSATPEVASAPLTDEEKLYTVVNEKVTAKEVTNLRTAATTKSDIVTKLKNGKTVTRIGIGKNGWSKLKYNGKIVYAITSYLTTDLTIIKPEKPEESEEVDVPKKDIVAGHTFEPKNDKVTAKDIVNLRALPTTDSEIVGELKSGDFLKRTAVSDKGWSRLIYKGKDVYAVTSYLSNKVIKQEPDEPETPSDGFETVDEQVTAKEETNLRTKPTTQDSEVVYTLKNGEYIKRIGVHANGWSKLEYNGQTVYAISSYLTK